MPEQDLSSLSGFQMMTPTSRDLLQVVMGDDKLCSDQVYERAGQQQEESTPKLLWDSLLQRWSHRKWGR